MELQLLNKVCGIRGNWMLSSIESTLHDCTQDVDNTPYSSSWERWLHSFLVDYEQAVTNFETRDQTICQEDYLLGSCPVVLKINSAELLKKELYPVVISARPPGKIVPIPYLQAKDIEGVSFPHGLTNEVRQLIQEAGSDDKLHILPFDTIPTLTQPNKKSDSCFTQPQIVSEYLGHMRDFEEEHTPPKCMTRYGSNGGAQGKALTQQELREMADQICALLSEGQSMRAVCLNQWAPEKSTIFINFL